jgi:hypothetical protein
MSKIIGADWKITNSHRIGKFPLRNSSHCAERDFLKDCGESSNFEYFRPTLMKAAILDINPATGRGPAFRKVFQQADQQPKLLDL